MTLIQRLGPQLRRWYHFLPADLPGQRGTGTRIAASTSPVRGQLWRPPSQHCDRAKMSVACTRGAAKPAICDLFASGLNPEGGGLLDPEGADRSGAPYPYDAEAPRIERVDPAEVGVGAGRQGLRRLPGRPEDGRRYLPSCPESNWKTPSGIG